MTGYGGYAEEVGCINENLKGKMEGTETTLSAG